VSAHAHRLSPLADQVAAKDRFRDAISFISSAPGMCGMGILPSGGRAPVGRGRGIDGRTCPGRRLAMADVVDRETKSRIMAAVRSSGNRGAEVRVAAILRTAGIRGWRRGQRVTSRQA